MKKILFFTDTTLYGGAENQMILLAEFLDRKKFHVFVAGLSSPHLSLFWEKLKWENIETIPLPYRHKHDPRILTALKKILIERNIDLLHLHLWNPASCRYGFLAGNKLKIPIVITEHDPFSLPLLKTFIKKRLTKNVKAIIAISRANVEFLKKEFSKWGDKIFLVPNGIDVDEWEKKLANAAKHQSEEKILLQVGTLHARKGHDILLKAFAKVAEKRPNVKLNFAGDGPERKPLENLAKKLGIENKVSFLGQQSDISSILKSADVFVYPSRREAFGMALLEAGLAKLPVVASNVGGIPDLIEDGKTGLLFEKENVENLASTLENLLVHEHFMKSLSENLFHKVKSEFSAEAMAKAMEKIYDSILA